MISAYTGTQVRAAEEPLLAAGLGDVLMQRAAHGMANAVIIELRARSRRIYGARLVVLAGKGNNGGDGLYAAAFLAARFAAKEAVAKVLGAPAGMNWQDCWIGLDHNGPTVQVKGTVLAVAEAKGVKRWHLSISHDGGIATATVLAEG